jgi:DnaJ-class molecular chaperone
MNPTKPTKTKCKSCDGRGELYNGCPDAMGVETEKCTACKGKGYRELIPDTRLEPVLAMAA